MAGFWKRFARGLWTARGMAALYITAVVLSACAAGADPRTDALHRQRAAATRALTAAQEQVRQARTKATTARDQMDAFLAQYFGDQGARILEPANTPPPSAVMRESTLREQQRLAAQLQEMGIRRSELLSKFTEAHPEVGDVDRRILMVREQLTAIDQAAQANASATPDAFSQQSANRAEPMPRGEAAAQFAPLYDAWQQAERELLVALEAETIAAQDLVALDAAMTELSTPSIAPAEPIPNVLRPQPAQGPVDSSARPTPDGREMTSVQDPAIATTVVSSPRDSQSAVMAALVIALILAALAAVRLARTSSDQVFYTADEVSAALAVPVVGIIPHLAGRGLPSAWNFRRLRRGAVVGLQFLLALAVFALVAYLIQQPRIGWRTEQSPAAHVEKG